MEKEITPDIVHKILEKTLAYSLESVRVNEDGSISHLHSMEFLEKHPERKDSPEFTEEEEREMMDYVSKLAKRV